MKEGFHRVLAAIRALPEPQREAAMLFYIKDYSQREIAAFLEVPVTTVNNRLHAARKSLRERLAMMSEKIGRVSEVRGPLVDVRFEPEDMPPILSALTIADGAGGQGETLQVVQRVGDGVARCLARGRRAGVAPGATVVNTGGPMLAPVDVSILTEIMPLLSTLDGSGARARKSSGAARPELLETGIKVIDLLCPCATNGAMGIFGPGGAGNLVLCAEVLRNIAHDADGCAIFAFLHGEAGARYWYDAPEEVPQPTGAGRLICLPIDNPIDAASPAVLAASQLLDARAYLSSDLGRSGLWPAVDPLLSTSRLLDPAIVGPEHYDVACGARRLLRRYRELQESAPDGKTRQLTAEEIALIARARKVQRFFTQPFAVAAPFTGRPGQVVPLAETIRACEALLAGAYDDTPEGAFMWRGAID